MPTRLMRLPNLLLLLLMTIQVPCIPTSASQVLTNVAVACSLHLRAWAVGAMSLLRTNWFAASKGAEGLPACCMCSCTLAHKTGQPTLCTPCLSVKLSHMEKSVLRKYSTSSGLTALLMDVKFTCTFEGSRAPNA